MYSAFFWNLRFLEKAQRFLGIPKKRGLSIESAALSIESTALSAESAVTENAKDTALSAI